MNIPFLSFTGRNKYVREETIETFQKFFDSEWYVLGNFTKQFEEDYAKFNQTKYCIGVSNGLDALHLALETLGLGRGDEVIVPSNTYIATALAVTYTGAKPVFVEPRIETYNINPDLIENAITTRTKAIMPVHLYGQACEMDKIMKLARKHKLFVVEDNAQAHGATFNGKLTSSFGDINGVSFYPTKNLGAIGEAGAVTTDSGELADKVRVLRNYGSQKRYYNEVVGYNNRIDEFEAAFLSIALKYLSTWNEERNKVASLYSKELQGVGDLTLPYTTEGSTHVYHIFVIRSKMRDKLQQYLYKNGINTVIHYPIPPHLQSCYKNLGYELGDFIIAEEIARTCLSLPLFIGMKEKEISFVSAKIKDFFVSY
jgi:dTDP-4-amino-4,6-dideoxygalactose transaminase